MFSICLVIIRVYLKSAVSSNVFYSKFFRKFFFQTFRFDKILTWYNFAQQVIYTLFTNDNVQQKSLSKFFLVEIYFSITWLWKKIRNFSVDQWTSALKLVRLAVVQTGVNGTISEHFLSQLENCDFAKNLKFLKFARSSWRLQMN